MILYRIHRIAGVLLVLFCLQSSAPAQQGLVVESKVDKNQILIGDVITYSILVIHDKSIELNMPPLAANLGMFEIREYNVIDPVSEGDQIVSQYDYLISTFDTGNFEIPELPIDYRVKGDSLWQQIKTEPITIVVESLNPDEAGDIRDIKPPLTPPRNYRALITWILLALLGVTIIALIIYVIKRRREGKSIIPRREKPPRPAHDVAIDALDELMESSLIQRGEIKEYYTRLSDIVREYIANRFFILAPEMTTNQLMAEMRETNVEDVNIALVADLLAQCDLVKFAKFAPRPEAHETATKMAYDFVDQTKLVVIASTSDSEEKANVLEEDDTVVMEEQVQEETEDDKSA